MVFIATNLYADMEILNKHIIHLCFYQFRSMGVP